MTAFRLTSSDYPDIITSDTGSKSLYLQVETTSGGRANGFHLWAGAPYPPSLPRNVNARNATLLGDPSQEDTGGVAIYGQGRLPMAIYPARTPITMTLAYIPPEAAGYTLRVQNFDLKDPWGLGLDLEFDFEGAPFTPVDGDISLNGAWAGTNLQIPGPDQFFGAFLLARYREVAFPNGNGATWRVEFDDLVTQLATVRIID